MITISMTGILKIGNPKLTIMPPGALEKVIPGDQGGEAGLIHDKRTSLYCSGSNRIKYRFINTLENTGKKEKSPG